MTGEESLFIMNVVRDIKIVCRITSKGVFVTQLSIVISGSTRRNHDADKRWSFSAIVDELLEIVDELPNSKINEV
jgi:hypothetical protein